MAELQLKVDCPLDGCEGPKILVPAQAMTAVWPSRLGRAEVQIEPDNAKFKQILIGHFLEHHPGMLDPDLAAELQLSDTDVDKLLEVPDGEV